MCLFGWYYPDCAYGYFQGWLNLRDSWKSLFSVLFSVVEKQVFPFSVWKHTFQPGASLFWAVQEPTPLNWCQRGSREEALVFPLTPLWPSTWRIEGWKWLSSPSLFPKLFFQGTFMTFSFPPWVTLSLQQWVNLFCLACSVLGTVWSWICQFTVLAIRPILKRLTYPHNTHFPKSFRARAVLGVVAN